MLFKLGILGYLAFSLVIGNLGCAIHSGVASPRNATMGNFLKNDWEKKKTSIEVQKKEWQACSKENKIESICNDKNVPRFETYHLEKTSLPYGVVTNALYCPPEKKYWIAQSGGDMHYRCRSFGPFTVDI